MAMREAAAWRDPARTIDRGGWCWASEWRIPAPTDAVWEALSHPEQWPEWWPYVARVEKLARDDTGRRGEKYRFVWRTRLPYCVRFDSETFRIQRPNLIAARATGRLRALGVWRLSAEDTRDPRAPVTRVEYEWRIHAVSGWMRLTAPLLAPVFKWNHDAVMAAGQIGLQRYLSRSGDRP